MHVLFSPNKNYFLFPLGLCTLTICKMFYLNWQQKSLNCSNKPSNCFLNCILLKWEQDEKNRKKNFNLYLSRLLRVPFTVPFTVETGEISPWYRIPTKLWHTEMCHKSTSNTGQKINNRRFIFWHTERFLTTIQSKRKKSYCASPVLLLLALFIC